MGNHKETIIINLECKSQDSREAAPSVSWTKRIRDEPYAVIPMHAQRDSLPRGSRCVRRCASRSPQNKSIVVCKS